MLAPGAPALTILLALLTALGPLSTDMYLPSLPAIGRALGADTAAVQLTLSSFLVGFALGQIVYGPLSDRIGRKPVLLAGLAIYAVGSAACALASSIELLIAARLLQALGACGPIVLARSIARDMFEGQAAARQLSLMGTIMGVVPATAPMIGGALEVLAGWRSSFLLSAVVAVAAFGWCWVSLPETLRAGNGRPATLASFASDFAALLRHRGFRLYLWLVMTIYSGIFAFISGSSFVLQTQMGLDEMTYGLAFGTCAGTFVLGTMLGRKLLSSRSTAATIRFAAALMAASGLTLVVAHAVLPMSALAIIVPMMGYMAGVGAGMPLSQAMVLMPFPDRAGAASSLMGLSQMSFAALVGAWIGHGTGSSAWPLVGTVAVLGALSYLTTRVIARVAP